MDCITVKEIIDALNNIGKRDWLEYLTLIITIGATVLNIWLANRNTNKQIKNQNKETYRPRLKLKNIKVVEYNINDIYLYAHSVGFKEKKEGISLYVDITLENIGN